MNSLDLPGAPQENRIVVAMSGGVDSSVVAALLHQEGYQVVGITLQLYDNNQTIKYGGTCCAIQDIRDARKVAEKIGIPHYVLNYESRFQQEVINPFVASYVAGETPVPCISCNKEIKFVDMVEAARALGAKAVATGHYVQSKIGETKRTLHRSIDHGRDQSYFLFTMQQDQIDYFRFPLGGLTKIHVRKIAENMGLPVFEKPDSQDICFVPDGKYSDIVKKFYTGSSLSGEIVHLDGRCLGKHDGIFHYTVGQRRGIGIASSEPLYVIHLDAATARVIVGQHQALQTYSIYVRDVNWLGDEPLENLESINIFIKVRSSNILCPAKIMPYCNGIRVDLFEGEIGVSPGQACVFYASDHEDARILGGGFITETCSDFLTEKMLSQLGCKKFFLSNVEK